ESPYAVYWPPFAPASLITQTVHLDGAEYAVPPVTLPPRSSAVSPLSVAPSTLPPAPGGPTRRAPLGRIMGARSGDKGGNANVGVWARTPEAYAWLLKTLTVDAVKGLVPEARSLVVDRYPLPNLLAINFVIRGLLGDGVAS